MKIKLTRLNEQVALRATNESGQQIDMDGSSTVGGQNLGMRPMETLLSSLAACSSIDILVIMAKKRIALKHFEVHVQGHRKDGVPASFEQIHIIFEISADDPKEAVAHAAQLSLEKYCSVAASLSSAIVITHEIKSND